MAGETFVHNHPEIMSGAPVFIGTRVPVQALFDCLEEGGAINEFLGSFPTVTREQAVGFLSETTSRAAR
ncbi:DUF433 domain-containing protein [Longimicrobium sp.]|jgi:uncharacterized protein (DUF433 family)|uniref:DUF433 domain-containing protein n=1 Tax=Longimicrobium sp. TaxID=2029185 RepID=UPI002F926733